jgi:predicted small lipoprotein YifL
MLLANALSRGAEPDARNARSDRSPAMPRYALTVLTLVVLGAALGLSGCGRKGKLDPPPGEALVEQNGKQVDPGIVKPKKSFFLDPLLN